MGDDIPKPQHQNQQRQVCNQNRRSDKYSSYPKIIQKAHKTCQNGGGENGLADLLANQIAKEEAI